MAALAASSSSRAQNAPSADGKSSAPKAWTTGTNPLTQRSTSSTPANGWVNGHGQPSQEPGKASSRESNTPDKHLNDRLVFLLSNLVGLDVNLSLKNGDRFTGVFSGASTQGEPRYHLKMVRKRHANQQNGTSTPAPFVGEGEDHAASFDVAETEQLSATAVSFASTQPRAANGLGFKTDVEISGNLNLRERHLQRWTPGPEDQSDMSLGNTDGLGSSGTWDQFAANEKLYNVRSDYNEDLYTTTIDKSSPLYKQRAAEAERLAREIEGSSRSTAQVDSGLDEEDKYSGVRRDAPALAKSGPNAYVPPSKRGPAPTSTATAASNSAAEAAILKSINATPVSSNAPAEAATNGKQAAQKTDAESATGNSKGAAVRALAANSDGTLKPPIESSPDLLKDVTSAFKQFTQTEKIRLQSQRNTQQQVQKASAQKEKSVKLNDLKKFSQNFKLHSRVPEDLVPILAKSKEKQDEIVKKADEHVREKEAKDAADSTTPPKNPRLSPNSSTTGTATPIDTPRDSTPSATPRTRSQQQVPKQAAAPAVRPPSQVSQRSQVPSRGSSAAAGAPGPAAPPPSSTTSVAQSTPRVLSPPGASALRFNAKAMEFKPNPAASTFTPGASSSDGPGSKRPSIASPAAIPAQPQQFFSPSAGKCKLAQAADASPRQRKAILNPVAKAFELTQADPAKKAQYASNGGIPQGYRTAPVWDHPEHNAERSYNDFFSRTMHPAVSPMHGMNGAMPHQHQLPLHLQSGPQPPHPGQPPFYRAGPPDEAQRMHFSSSTSSIAPSPRMGQQMLYPTPPQPMPGYPYMPPGGMSPGMAMRSPMPMHMMPQQQMYPPMGYPGQPVYGSPRGVPMSHQGSQQGYMMPGAQRGYGYPGMYNMNRQMSSGGYSAHQTPRGQPAVPHMPPAPVQNQEENR